MSSTSDRGERPIVTPEETLSIRGVDVETLRFPMAALLFRGKDDSERLLEAFGVEQLASKAFDTGLEGIKTVGNRKVFMVGRMMYGGPYTASVLEKLRLFGVQSVIGMGVCGSLVEDAPPGTWLIADGAFCSDGTSKEYTTSGEVYPDADMLRIAEEAFERRDLVVRRGKVWTTDAIYREFPSKIAYWRDRGALFVNMESAPFYAVAETLGMQAVYVGYVSDYVGGTQWISWDWDRSKRDAQLQEIGLDIMKEIPIEWRSHINERRKA